MGKLKYYLTKKFFTEHQSLNTSNFTEALSSIAIFRNIAVTQTVFISSFLPLSKQAYTNNKFLLY